jgi:hypothetical protein
MNHRIRLFLIIGLVLLLITGCRTSRKARTVATGEVTVGGQLVKSGRITFGRVGSNSSISANVRDGRFALFTRHAFSSGEYDVKLLVAGNGSNRSLTERVTVAGGSRPFVVVNYP